MFLIILKSLFCIYCGDEDNSKDRFSRTKMYCRFCGSVACVHHHSDFKEHPDRVNWPEFYKSNKKTAGQFEIICKPCKSTGFDTNEVYLFYIYFIFKFSFKNIFKCI